LRPGRAVASRRGDGVTHAWAAAGQAMKAVRTVLLTCPPPWNHPLGSHMLGPNAIKTPQGGPSMIKRIGLFGAALLGTLLCSFALAQVTLTFWSWRVEDVAAYEQLIAQFEAENPGIEVEYQAFESQTYATLQTTALAAGEGPDIIHVRAYGAFEAIAGPGYLLPLDDKVPALADFPPLALDGNRLRRDGLVYAVPFASQTIAIYYNVDIFEELGLELPETWDEFIATAQQIQAAGYIPIGNGTATAWMDEILMGAFAPNFYGPEFFGEIMAGETTFEDERFVGALEKLLELRPYLAPQHQGVDNATAQNLFVNELAAMYVGGSFEIANFRRLNPDLNFSVLAPPVPVAGQTPLVSWWLDGGYAVNAASAHPDEAVRFANYLASREFGQMFSDLLANISPIPGVDSSDPLLARFIELNQNSTPYIMLVGFRYQEPTGSVLVQERLPGMFAGTITPEQVAKEVTEGIAGYFEPFQNR
jgi:raffinose/stachyose/melibiose transport system substrate-binding protein